MLMRGVNAALMLFIWVVLAIITVPIAKSFIFPNSHSTAQTIVEKQEYAEANPIYTPLCLPPPELGVDLSSGQWRPTVRDCERVDQYNECKWRVGRSTGWTGCPYGIPPLPDAQAQQGN